MRDLLLGVTPFWMSQPSYLVVTGVALVFVMVFRKYVVHMNNTIFIFDAIGLSLFVVVGIERSLDAGFPFWVAITMGMITGSIGSVTRDILINELPLIFRKDIYALACVFGGFVYLGCYKLGGGRSVYGGGHGVVCHPGAHCGGEVPHQRAGAQGGR